jgi:acyl carrier protein
MGSVEAEAWNWYRSRKSHRVDLESRPTDENATQGSRRVRLVDIRQSYDPVEQPRLDREDGRSLESKSVVQDLDYERKNLMTTHVETTESKLRKIISYQIGVTDDEITSDAKLIQDLGADSIDTMEVLMSIEQEFGIEIPDDEAKELETFQQLLAYVEKRRAS